MEENNIETKFNKAKEFIKLSKEERDFHRQRILKFIEMNEKKPSPFSFGYFLKSHAVFATFVLLMILTSTISVAANESLPGEYLYTVKIKVNEPVEEFLTVKPEKKASLSVERVNKRLQEYSTISLENKVDLKTQEEVKNQLNSEVKTAHAHISKLAEDNKISEAVNTANDLQSVLGANDILLGKITEVNPEVVIISENVKNNTEETEKLINNITDNIEVSESISEIDESIIEHEKETTALLEELSVPNEINNKIIDQKDIDSELEDVSLIIEDAKQKNEEGNKIESFDLFNQADQKLGKIKYLIEADQELNIPKN